MISGHGNIETAVSAIKRGAYDFIEKPFKADRLLLVADRALENSRLKREVRQLKQFAPLAATLVGRSPSINQLRALGVGIQGPFIAAKMPCSRDTDQSSATDHHHYDQQNARRPRKLRKARIAHFDDSFEVPEARIRAGEH